MREANCRLSKIEQFEISMLQANVQVMALQQDYWDLLLGHVPRCAVPEARECFDWNEQSPATSHREVSDKCQWLLLFDTVAVTTNE